MRASLVRAAMEIMFALGCGAVESTKGLWQSRSVCHGHADSSEARCVCRAARVWGRMGLSLSVVSVMQTFHRTDPLPSGSPDTRGAHAPQPHPTVVSTAASSEAGPSAPHAVIVLNVQFHNGDGLT